MIVIPARLGSSRFPGKVLADILGTPMVIRTAQAASAVERVVIATDHEEIMRLAERYGFEAVLTSRTCRSGTERILEAVERLDLPSDEIVVNVQADEPFIEREVIGKVHALAQNILRDDTLLAVSAYKRISNPEADDPNLVKVVTDHEDRALYFSRSKIPYPRDHHFDDYKGHLGIYGFTVESLRVYGKLPPSPLEEIERLEQLRILYAGYSVAMTEVETESFGIDTPDDLSRALRRHQL